MSDLRVRVLSLSLPIWGVYPTGVHAPIFVFLGKLVAAEYAFAGVGGHFFAPALERDGGAGRGAFRFFIGTAGVV